MGKVAEFCERLIEAGWLAALVTVPLYFDVYTSRVFEPDKITFLRCLVLIMLVAQAVVLWSQGRRSEVEASPSVASRMVAWRTKNPLLLPTLAFVGADLIATVASIDPAKSLFGSYQRLEGTYTDITYVALFILVVSNLRTPAQLSRLITTVILTSIPISLYGIVQHLQLDPLPWGGDVAFRVTSTMGNAIFLAAYLIMVVPLTTIRLYSAMRRAREQNLPEGKSAGGVVGTWALIIILQNAACALPLLLNQSVFGIWWIYPGIIGLFMLLATVPTTTMPSRRLARAEAAALALVIVVQVACIFLTQSRGPWLGLLAGILVLVLLLETRSKRPKALLLGTVAAVSILGAVLIIFNVRGSPLARFRSLPYVGRLGQLTDVSNGTGRVRVLIWQGTLTMLATHPDVGFRPDPLGVARLVVGYGPETMHEEYNKVYPPALGDLESRNALPDRNHNDLLDHLVMTGVLGLVAYVALVVSALILGLRTFLSSTDPDHVALLAGLLAVIVAHVAETQTGIAIAPTLTYFWVALALLVVLAGRGASLMAATVPVTTQPETPATALQKRSTRRGRSGAVAFRKEREATVAAPPSRSQIIVAVAVFVAIVVIGQTIISAISPSNAQLLILGAFTWLALALPTWAWIHRPASGIRSELSRKTAFRTIIPIIAVGAALIAMVLNLNQLAADVYQKQGTIEDQQQQYAASVSSYAHAIALAPSQAYYYLFLGRALLGVAKSAPIVQASPQFNATLNNVLSLSPSTAAQLGRVDALRAAQVVLERAKQIEPLDPDHYANLARLYRFWGETTNKSKLALASREYDAATTLSPHSAQLFDEWAITSLEEGDFKNATSEAIRATQLDPKYVLTHVVLGDIYLENNQASKALAQHLQALSLDPAALSDANFEHRAALYVKDGQGRALLDRYQQLLSDHPSATVRNSYAFLLLEQGKPAEAVTQYRLVVQAQPGNWLAERNLAVAYSRIGDQKDAVAVAQAALNDAPAGERQGIQSLLKSLQK